MGDQVCVKEDDLKPIPFKEGSAALAKRYVTEVDVDHIQESEADNACWQDVLNKFFRLDEGDHPDKKEQKEHRRKKIAILRRTIRNKIDEFENLKSLTDWIKERLCCSGDAKK